MKTKLFTIALAAILFTSNASAALIVGNIGWAGMWDRTGDVITLDATSLIMANEDLAGAGITGDFDPISIDLGNFAPVELWSAGGFTLVLNSISILFDDGVQNTLFSGSGIMTTTNAGLETTPFMVTYSVNPFTFSASAVPEPMTGLMLTSGLVALVSLRRRVRH